MLLLTGATGLVGSELEPLLAAARPERRIVRLSRPEFDLARPDLGIDDARLRELEAGVTEIVHCAADTRFQLPLQEARIVNRDGTRRLLDLARRCRRLEKFVHVSTVYVVGRAAGRFREAPLRHGAGFCNTYQQSKYEAEQLVLEARREIPAAIVRLSSIIGDSRTGRVRQFNHVHQLLRLLPRNILPVAPGDPAARIDLIPSDWAARALAFLIDHAFVAGGVYHLCAGPEGSLTLGQMLDCTLEALPGPVKLPRLVSLREYEQYVEKAVRAGDRLLNELLRVLGFFLPHLGLRQLFDNRRARQALAGGRIELPPIGSYYSKVVRYCVATDWGRAAVAGR